MAKLDVTVNLYKEGAQVSGSTYGKDYAKLGKAIIGKMKIGKERRSGKA